MSKKKVLLRGVFINRDTNGEGVLKVGTTLIRVSTVMGILYGMYILSGEGMYLLDETWMGIKKDDFVWFGAYCPQCSYGVGREPFAYIYSKDCNRDVEI